MNRLTRLAVMILFSASALIACAVPDNESRAPRSSTISAAAPTTVRQELSENAPIRPDSLPPEASPSSSGVAENLLPGQDYVVIPGGRPYRDDRGKIEVVEVFGYVCPACARFHPLVSSWVKTLPRDVVFRYIPAPFGPDWDPYARGFYVADAMGLVPRTHDALINAIHVAHLMPGEGQKPTDEAVAKFYAGYGVDADDFLSQMRSFANDARMRRGKQFLAQSGIEGTPTLIVAGKYRVLGKTYRDSLQIADQLIDRERRERSGAPRR